MGVGLDVSLQVRLFLVSVGAKVAPVFVAVFLVAEDDTGMINVYVHHLHVILFQSEKCNIGLQSFAIVFVWTREPILSIFP